MASDLMTSPTPSSQVENGIRPEALQGSVDRTSPPDAYLKCTYLAHEIEWVNAMDRASRRRPSGRTTKADRKAAAHSEFDPMAATCLADLIHHRLFGTSI